MKFSHLDIDVPVKQLSTRQSRNLNANIQAFAKNMKRTDEGKLEAQDNDVARFLTEQVHYLLRNVYGANGVVPENIDDFEDKITLEEVCSFLKEQVDKCGVSDFLIQPLNALLQGMMKVTAAIPGIVDANSDRAVQSMKIQ